MDIPRVGDPFWDTKRKQANGIVKRVIRDEEDAEYPEVYVEFYDGTSAFYDWTEMEGCYTTKYGVGGWEVS